MIDWISSVGLVILWLSLGLVGAQLAYLGSVRDYGKDIYGKKRYILCIFAGVAGFFGSMVAW